MLARMHSVRGIFYDMKSFANSESLVYSQNCLEPLENLILMCIRYTHTLHMKQELDVCHGNAANRTENVVYDLWLMFTTPNIYRYVVYNIMFH